MNQFSLKSRHANISDFFSYGVMENILVGKNLSMICNRNSKNYPSQFKGFPLRVLIFEEDPMSISWSRFPKAFRNSILGQLYKYNPLTAGYNGLAVAGLIQALNFTTNFKFLNGSDEKYSNKKKGIIVGSGEVAYSKYDFVGVLHFMVSKTGMDYEYLNPVLFDKYCVVAPKAKRMSLVEASLRCFSLESWLFILSIPWTLALTMKSMNLVKFYKEPGLSHSRLSSFYKVLFGQTTVIKTHAQRERWLLAVCMCFSIIFTTIFNAFMTSHITTERRYKEIDTLEQLADSGLKIVTSSSYMINVVFGEVNNTTDPVIKRLRNNFESGKNTLSKTIEGRSCCIRQSLDYEITNVSLLFALYLLSLRLFPKISNDLYDDTSMDLSQK